MLGTIAWIAVTNLIGYMGWGDKVTIFYISMVVAAVMGLYSFTLPIRRQQLLAAFLQHRSLVKTHSCCSKQVLSHLLYRIGAHLHPAFFYYAMANPSITDAYKMHSLQPTRGNRCRLLFCGK